MVFEHPIFHEGSELISGRKYTIRTDVMFSSQIIKPKKKKDSTTTEVTTILKQTDIDDELSPPESTTDNKPHSGKTIILPVKFLELFTVFMTMSSLVLGIMISFHHFSGVILVLGKGKIFKHSFLLSI